MLDTCKVVKKAKKESHDVLGKHVTKLSTYSKLEYIPIEKKYRKVEICKICRKSIETFVSNTKKVYRVNCGCYCQKRRQKKIMWTVLSLTVCCAASQPASQPLFFFSQQLVRHQH